MILHIKTREEQRDGTVLRGLQYDVAFKIMRIYVRPAWALKITVFLFINPAATCRKITYRHIHTHDDIITPKRLKNPFEW